MRCGSENKFLVATSFPRSLVFRDLLPWFSKKRTQVLLGSPFRQKQTSRGRNPLLATEDLLGLVLWYLKSGDVEYSLSPIFGIVPSSVSQWLDYGMEVMYAAVSDDEYPAFRICWPTESEMEEYCELLRKNRLFGYALRGVFGVSDGARLRVPDFEDPDTQNAYYNAMTQRVEATNLLVWNFHGEIIHAALNFPGSWHDSRSAYISGCTGLRWLSTAILLLALQSSAIAHS
ncbi:DDE family endonuclease [Gracilaria domingensis]|nr:DDE family endonuclease [Gracilaria domingensis]